MAAHILTLDPSDYLVVSDAIIKTSSLKVAEAFGKRHSHVLEKIDRLDCSPEFASANFSAHEELIQAGAVKRRSRIVEMTKDGFMFLVMGFTGKRAAAIKEAYINAFNWMAEQLSRSRCRPIPETALTPAQQQAIQARVRRLGDSPLNKHSYQSVYGLIHATFGVHSYVELPAAAFPRVMDLLNGVALGAPLGAAPMPLLSKLPG